MFLLFFFRTGMNKSRYVANIIVLRFTRQKMAIMSVYHFEFVTRRMIRHNDFL